VLKVGVQDQFGEVGPEEYLRERFGLGAGDVVEKAETALVSKKELLYGEKRVL
jgi:transketolase